MAQSKSNLPYLCKHNQIVGCSDPSACWKCGWNPEVAEKRKAELRRVLNPKPLTITRSKKRTLAVTWLERR